MDFKQAMESVQGLENSEEVISAITGRISKANQDNIDYKSSLAEKDTEINGLNETSKGFLTSIGVDSFDSAKTSFESLKSSSGESGEQSLTISKLQNDLSTLNESLSSMKADNESKEAKIQESKKNSIIKEALFKNGMIDSNLVVGSFAHSLKFDSEGELVDSKGNSIDKVMENSLETDPHLKKSTQKSGTGGKFKGSSNSGSSRKELEDFLA